METNSPQAFVSLKRNKETEISAFNLICKLEKCYICLNSSKNSRQDVKFSWTFENLLKLRKKCTDFANISTALGTLLKEGEENCRKIVKNYSLSNFPWCSSCRESLEEVAKLQEQIRESEEKIDTLISKLIASRSRNVNTEEGDYQNQEAKGSDVLANSPSPVSKDGIEIKKEIEDFDDEELLQEFSIPFDDDDDGNGDDGRVEEESEKLPSSDDDTSDNGKRKAPPRPRNKTESKRTSIAGRNGNLNHKKRRRCKYNVDLSNVDLSNVDTSNPVCPHCCRKFNSMKSISAHIKRKHLKIRRHPCAKCDKGFFSRGELKRHNRTWHNSDRAEEEGEEKTKPEKSFPCSKCGKTFTSQRYCIAHQVISCKVEVDPEILTKLNITFYQCEWENCTALFHREKNLIRHVFTHTEDKVSCPQCGKQFSRANTLKKHAESSCEKRIETNDAAISKTRPPLKRPRSKTPKESMLKCPKCPKRFVLQKTLDLHLTRHPTTGAGVVGSLKSICHLCGKLMNDYQIPIHVQQVHEKKLRFFCKYCGKGFFTKFSINAHVKSIHERDKDAPPPEKKIQCDQCSNMFATLSGLNDHVRRVHFKITRCSCEICGMKFYHKNDLRKHGQKHNGKNGKTNILAGGKEAICGT